MLSQYTTNLAGFKLIFAGEQQKLAKQNSRLAAAVMLSLNQTLPVLSNVSISRKEDRPARECVLTRRSRVTCKSHAAHILRI